MILKTEEMFRVAYDDGDVHRLMKQTYTDSPPFYSKSIDGNGYRDFTPVETSSSSLKKIIKHYKNCLRLDRKATSTQNNKEIKKIYDYCAGKTKEFLDKLIELQLKEV